MSDDPCNYTASFRPGGKDYDSPLVVVRANTEEDLLVRLEADPEEDDLGTAIARFHEKLRRQFTDVMSDYGPAEAKADVVPTPIWASAAASGGLTPNPDGTYPPCPHGTRPRKPWKSPRNGKVYLFCALDKGAPGACPTVTL